MFEYNKKTNFTQSHLGRRLVLYIIIFSITLSLFTSIYQLYGVYKKDINNVKLELNEISESYSADIAERIWVSNKKELDSALLGLLRLPDIEYIEVYEDDRLLSEVGNISSENVIERIIPLKYLYKGEQLQIGSMKITVGLTHTHQKIIEQAITITLNNVIHTFIVSGFMLLLFYHLVAKQLHKIASYASTIRLDNLDKKLSLNRRSFGGDSGDDLGQLVESINRMQMNMKQTLNILEEQKFILNEHSIVTMTDSYGLITYANDKFSDISGYSNGELIGKNHRIINSGYHPPEFFAEIWQTISSGNVWHGEICNKSKNGTLYWVLSTLAPNFDSNGKIVQYTAIRTDITNIKQTEKLLRRTQKMEAIGELTGGIAHDFNNLLGIIMGNLDLMTIKTEGEHKIQKQINNAQSAALRGAELTRKLLNFSRQSEEVYSPVNIFNIINENKDFIRKSITASINLKIHITDELWLVDINPGDFQDVIINLSLNARDAMPSGGTLIFEAKNKIFDKNIVDYNIDLKAGEYIEIMVSDSGIGMNKETLSKIFDPFYTTKDKSKGTGLGLPMVFGFIKRCKGSITVCSDEGVGTTFKIYIPRSKRVTEESIIPTSIDMKMPPGKETVLIVDDEPDLAAIAKSVLDSLGYTTICVFSVYEAQEILDKNDGIDLLFSDVVMPGDLNGFDFADNVLTANPEIKILLTSGFTGKITQKKSVEKWSRNLLSKPYRDLELAMAIRKTLDD
jgi:PAS domain S-box-containing protein